MRCADKALPVLFAAVSLIVLDGCDRMVTSRHAQLVQDAETKAGQGDFLRAISLYEAALDDSPACADVHYKLGLLYDDKMKEPLSALHHFKRYLVLSPNGPHASEVKNFMKSDEIALVTSLSGDSVVTRAEAARLRNENLDLRKKLDDRNSVSVVPAKSAREPSKNVPEKAGDKTYVVRSGDTLVSISRKFYRTPTRWKKILYANKKEIEDPERLKVGQSLIIP